MDPFSITVGAVGLADAGTSLAGFLTDKYRSYRDAPELILEVAHEVEFCAGLVDMFADSVDRADVGGKVPKKFVKDARGLVERVRTFTTCFHALSHRRLCRVMLGRRLQMPCGFAQVRDSQHRADLYTCCAFLDSNHLP